MLELGDIDQEMLVFGGPYSNLAATTAMRQRARDAGIAADRVICTGDLVAYCAEPAETLELIRDWGIHVVMGNCEEALAFNEPDCGCGFEEGSSCSTLASTWYRYADLRVASGLRRWMRGLSRSIAFEMSGMRFRAVHGSLSSINAFVFASSDAEAKIAQIREASADVVIGGHSGIPFGQRIDHCFWLNAGVIGMPANDGGSHGWYMLIDPTGERPMVSWHRLEYDYEISRDATIAAGMIEYGQALASGLWPSIDILPDTERRQRGQPLHLPPLSL
ncbi:MAG: metallophosphatase family protein [Gammaproteobacteria bacterium]|nr:metallophosphatase family protein [Gammaproteobacteria bacterium]MDH3446671.1 metallophosphatase family protein [Gammaproteobacteria bacterium]